MRKRLSLRTAEKLYRVYDVTGFVLIIIALILMVIKKHGLSNYFAITGIISILLQLSAIKYIRTFKGEPKNKSYLDPDKYEKAKTKYD